MLKRLALSSTALTFFLLGAGPAAADPLSAIATIIGAVAGGASVTTVIIGLALNAASTLLSLAMAPDTKQPPVGVKIEADVGDDKPVSTVIGRFATAGKRKYIGSHGTVRGTPNAYLTEVLELGSIPLSGRGLEGIFVDGERGTILWDQPDPNGMGYPIKELMDSDKSSDPKVPFGWVKVYNGTQTAADPYLVEKFGTDPDRPWTAAMVGRGTPYAIMTYRWRRKLFKGKPKVLFETSPLPLYDLRKDSTNGGNGAHRWEDQSTHEPSDNLAVMTYNVIRGLRYKGAWFYGGQGVSANRLPASNWIAACQEASRTVPRADGLTEPQFRGGYEITGDVQPIAIVEELRKAQNGRLTDQGGIFKLKNGLFGQPVFSFTDDDVLTTEPSALDPFPTLDATVNRVNGKYPNPDEGWTPKDAPVVADAALESRDKKRLAVDISIGATSHSRQVQQLLRAILKEARRFRKHEIPLPPLAYLLEAGIDVVGWTSPHNGYVNKRFLVIERRGNMAMNQTVVLQEIDPLDYDWVGSMQEIVSSGWIGRITVPPQPMPDFTVEPYRVKDTNGGDRRPGIKVTCPAGLDDVQNIRVTVRLKSSGAEVFKNDRPYAAPYEWVISDQWTLPATQYEVSCLLIPFSSRTTEPSAWKDVTTPDIRLSPEELHLDQLTDYIHSELSQLQDWVWRDTSIRDLIEDRKALARGVAEQDLANFADKQQLRTELVSLGQALTASFTDVITVATSATAALAQRVSTLEVTYQGFPAASVINTAIARVDVLDGQYTALAANLTTVQTGLNDKIGSTVFNSLASNVSQIGNTVTLQGDIINQIDLDLDGKASLTAQNALAGTVTQQGSTITSHGTLLNSLSAQVGDVSADARLRFEVVNNSGGTGYATIALQARFGTADSYKGAGAFIKTWSDPSKQSEFIVNANLFAVAAGNDENGVRMFAVDGNGAYLDSAYIRNLNVLKLVAGADTVFKVDTNGVYMDTAFIRSISTSKIIFADGSMQTEAMEAGDITEVVTISLAGGSWTGGNRDLTCVVDHGKGSPNVIIMGAGGCTAHPTDGLQRLGLTISPSTAPQISALPLAQGTTGGTATIAYHRPAAAVASTTYRVRMSCATATAAQEMSIIVLVGKR